MYSFMLIKVLVSLAREIAPMRVKLSLPLSVMQAAENLHEKLWGQNLNDKLKVLSDDGGTWKYLPKDYLDFIQLPPLGYREDVLLFREEYSAAVESFDPENAMKGGCRGVVVTGQPGIGMVLVIMNALLIITSSQENLVFSTICCFNY